MADTPEPLLHKEKLTPQGWPTGHALCDTGDGTFDGGPLAHNNSTATCEKCADWEPGDDEAGEETPEPAHRRMVAVTAVDIRAFIEARLAEDQALIERNADGNGLDDGFPDYRTYDDSDTRAADEYIDRFGPARMLREIDAKRAILALHMGGYVELEDGTRIPFCGDRSADPDFNGDLWAPCLTARLLAAPYRDHEDFDPAWSVTG